MIPLSSETKLTHFNSRPRKEVDVGAMDRAPLYRDISTHDLARRSTVKSENRYEPEYISTHDLARRSTDRLD